MSRLRRYACIFFTFVVYSASFVASGEEPETQSWLRGSGDDLEIRLRGEVLEADGQPAARVQVTGRMNMNPTSQKLEPTIDGHRFEIWIPVNRAKPNSLWLQAASPNGDRVALKTISTFQLRQFAIDGLKLTLKAPTRTVEVHVADKGQPVANAFVKAEMGYAIDLRSQTDSAGVSRFKLLPENELTHLTAWTDDFRIGGYSFSRTPTHDPHADKYVVELSSCRNQKIRLVDEAGKPVPEIDFVLQIATAPPHYNFIGTNEHFDLKTDADGKTSFPWFPNWDNHYFYVDLKTKQWFPEQEHTVDGDAEVFRLKRTKVAERKPVTGHVAATGTSAGGFCVTWNSFQSERENYSDQFSVYSDADGTFSASVLPDATYCVFVNDVRWAGEIVDLVPFESASNKTKKPELSVSAGQPVEIIANSGPQRRPYSNLLISLGRQHDFSWKVNGEEQHGMTGPRWNLTTDESGHATAYTLPGKLRVSVYTPMWRTDDEIDVIEGQPTRILLHRDVDEKQKVTGRLLLADGVVADLSDAEIQIGSIDGNYEDQQTLKSNKDGSFAFEILSKQVGLFAATKDGRAVGSAIVKDLSMPMEIRLQPTIDFHGQLLGRGDQPLVNHRVQAVASVAGAENFNPPFRTSFVAKQLEAKTDEQGNYTLRGVPGGVKLTLMADGLDNFSETIYLAEVFPEANESRPPLISHLAAREKPEQKKSLSQRYQATLRDAALSGFHVMPIFAGSSDAVTEFIKQNMLDSESNREVAAFMQLEISSDANRDKEDDAFLKERNWPSPTEGHVFAVALDAHGKELARLDLDVSEKGAANKAAKFIRQNAPPRVNAEKKWDEAFAEALQSNRRVWARVSQRYCGPCFRLSRWLDDHRALLEKDYVMLKIDDYRDDNGQSVAERITRGGQYGIPFYAIFDVDGNVLIDSAGPLGNIGFPTTFDDKKQIRKMLMQSRQRLTDKEINELVERIGD